MRKNGAAIKSNSAGPNQSYFYIFELEALVRFKKAF
jgi:hypothetical protein